MHQGNVPPGHIYTIHDAHGSIMKSTKACLQTSRAVFQKSDLCPHGWIPKLGGECIRQKLNHVFPINFFGPFKI